MENNKSIGRVLSVDNFRVFIKIDDDIKGSYKSGIQDIYEVARINSYLIIPVGSERIVAIITRVTMKEEVDFSNSTATITLPTSSRYISATMLGTITKINEKERFIQGVYNFPTLDNVVWYVTEKDLNHIFDIHKDADNIDYTKDYYLPVGTSPAFTNYQVKICPDQFFVKHAAILGNTGSGKSCTLTSILRNVFKFPYKEGAMQNAHVVIFDTNGEYKDAFTPTEDTISKDAKDLELINCYYYGEANTPGFPKVPYWFMNWDGFKDLLRPSDGTQAPILNRAIGLAKNQSESELTLTIPRHIVAEIQSVLETTSEELKKRTWDPKNGWGCKPNNEVQNIGEAVRKYNADLGNAIIELASAANFNNALLQDPIRKRIREILNDIIQRDLDKQITSEQNIDLPKWFSYQELCTKYIDTAINQASVSNNKIAEFISTLRLRMNSFLNDKRVAIPLMLSDDNSAAEILPHFISMILGEFNKCYSEAEKNTFVNTYNENNKPSSIKNSSQVVILDVSSLPYEVLETFAALIGRIILEFVSHFIGDNRGKYPIVIVLEEAQNYIAENKESSAKIVFERIAREGRKYGLSLIVSSQRPSELSKTVLSQCNSFVIHRLQNPDDQRYVRGLVSSANSDILEQLPIIPQQHAIITGDCVRTPVQVRIDDVSPTPNSHNPQFVNQWLDNSLTIPYDKTCKRWLENDE